LNEGDVVEKDFLEQRNALVKGFPSTEGMLWNRANGFNRSRVSISSNQTRKGVKP
jgi:hypothetical protein